MWFLHGGSIRPCQLKICLFSAQNPTWFRTLFHWSESRLDDHDRSNASIEASWIVVHNQLVMRRLAVLPACLPLLLAFFMAPFQHLHAVGGAGGRQDSPTIHAHPYPLSPPISQGPGIQVGDAHVATALNTFAFVRGIHPCLPFQVELAIILLFSQAKTYDTVEIVQARGHDPPCIDLSSPRAPPA